ncbi:MAG: TolC family protein [Opitutaceae bacterium]|nr:TolC family protein [Opitutaceae bacterium]
MRTNETNRPLRALGVGLGFGLLAFFVPPSLAAEPPPAALPAPPAVAAAYVERALAANLGLAGRALDVEAARARLEEVRGAWRPRVDVLARATLADGGRTIDIPTGDLLNGAYRTLNDYLRTQGRPPAFGEVPNQSIALLRSHEQETKVRVLQPLYRPELSRGVEASRAAVAGREAQLAAHRRELRLAVLMAYYTYLRSETALEILGSAQELAGEARRVNRVLADTGKLTEDRVLRAEADELELQQQRVAAERDRNHARAYFNTLLQRPLATAIDRVDETELRRAADVLLETPARDDWGAERREELLALQRAVEAATAGADAVKARSQPSVVLAVEGGIQGENYRTGGEARFVQGSLVAEFNLWDGRQRRSQWQQATLERRRAELQLADARQQLELQVRQAADEWKAAAAGFRAAQRRAEAAAQAFQLVRQREREGLANQLTFLDGRDALTRAELSRTLALHQVLMSAAALDRAAALSPAP